MNHHLNYTGILCPLVATHFRSTIIYYQKFKTGTGWQHLKDLRQSKRRSEGFVFSALIGLYNNWVSNKDQQAL